MNSSELRALYIHTRNLMEHQHLCCLLADHRAMLAALDSADQEWLLTQWVPETVSRTCYTHYAVLPALEPAHRLHTDPVVHDLRRRLSVALFENPDQAVRWLQTA
ncbi:hypothetical protein [Hymenobacter jejuensis]|uniref:Uncharacterized protein n=1 Tax=Hymenobacter jejuensis TaxID=2502781 RepID=A0A5B7ZYD1_9BACT|nr:hypothetical protein [Hymenobacter jejuensis]QDA60211.1 hypothetical protein FHG12_08850 [Hymenobacter jejuensis]